MKPARSQTQRWTTVALTIGLALTFISACAAPPPPTPETQVVVETVIVEGTPEVVERVITATPPPEPTAPPADQPLDVVRLSINSAMRAPDPHQQTSLASFIGLYLHGAQLFRLNPDFSVSPYLAEGYEISEDGLVYTITLKEGLVYSDGSPVTAEDVVYGYERSLELKNPRLLLLGPVASFEAADDRTVVITLEQPFPNILIGLADHGFSIFPKAGIEADPDFFSKAPIVTAGQYIMTEFTPGASEWAFEENPNFFGGPSMIKRLEFVAVPDQTSRVLQVTTGAIDYAYDMPPSAQADLPEEVGTYSVPIIGMYHLNFNLEGVAGTALGDPLVRQAISLAIDRDAISQRAFFGISPPAKGFMYGGPPESLAVLPNDGQRDVEAAQELLAQTPYADGFAFSIQPWGQRPGWTDAALIIKENLVDLNIEVTVEPKTDADAVANLTSGNYQAQFSGNTQDPLSFLKNQFAEGGTWTNWMRYNNPEVTRLLNEAGFAVDPEERIELFHEAQRLAYEDMPLIPISERVVMIGTRIPRNILCEANLLPGYNPRVATVEEFTSNTGPCAES
jgi:peptide/nickel transport system substrate-binding protein